jgi:hypothetical protein
LQGIGDRREAIHGGSVKNVLFFTVPNPLQTAPPTRVAGGGRIQPTLLSTLP